MSNTYGGQSSVINNGMHSSNGRSTVFFKVICRIEASRLPDIYKRFEDGGYTLIEQKGFFGEFVGARVYKK